MNEKQNLSSLIWNTADDILRGLFKPSEYGRIILPFLVSSQYVQNPVVMWVHQLFVCLFEFSSKVI